MSSCTSVSVHMSGSLHSNKYRKDSGIFKGVESFDMRFSFCGEFIGRCSYIDLYRDVKSLDSVRYFQRHFLSTTV